MNDGDMEKLKEFAAMMTEEVPLHPDFEPYLQESGAFGQILHHPLVILPFFRPGLANKIYEQKLEQLKDAEERGDWRGYVFLHERPYRMDALLKVSEKSPEPEAFWQLLGSTWVDSENIRESFDEWLQLWDSDIPGRENAMSEDERAVLAGLPDVVKIYRGITHEDAAEGMSWTLDRERAEWFARRFAGMEGKPDSLVVWATVDKKDIAAFFDGRNEREIVVDPSYVNVLDILPPEAGYEENSDLSPGF